MKKAKSFIILLIIVLTTVFLGCKGKETQDLQRTTDHQETTAPPTGDASDKTDLLKTNQPQSYTINTKDVSQQQPEKELTQKDLYNTQDKRMIICSGTMSMEVDKYDETESKVKDIVKTFGGYVTNSSSTLNASGKKQGSVTLRVASDKFDAMIAEISRIGKVMNQNISGKDVTEEYMDADARLKTQRELESRLLKLLEEKTARLTDVVEVEQKLSSVRENIERTEGRMRYLKDQASYSTLTVSIYEPSLLVTSSGGGFFYELGEAVKKGLNGFTSVLSGIITVVIALLPLIIVLYLVIYFAIRYFRKKKTVKVTAETQK